MFRASESHGLCSGVVVLIASSLRGILLKSQRADKPLPLRKYDQVHELVRAELRELHLIAALVLVLQVASACLWYR